MRRDDEEFLARDLELVYIAKSLAEAQALESQLTAASIDFSVEADTYLGGTIFRSERTGAFFYVMPDVAERVQAILGDSGDSPR